MARLAILLGIALSLAPAVARAQAQSGFIGVSATILEPVGFRSAASSSVSVRRGQYMDVAAPVTSSGPAGQIVSVQAVAADAASPASGADLLRVRGAGGEFQRVDGGPVAIGSRGKVGRGESEPVVYRIALGDHAAHDVRLALRYTIVPDA
jgi:hypothetical protein